MATDYNFLKELKITDPGRTRTPKVKSPEGMTMRIFSDGAVYPSIALVQKFSLEFVAQQLEDGGNGFDIIDTKNWKPLADQPRMLMIGVVPKDESKVDLFASCRYNEDGTPKSSVYDRGEKSEVLLNLVKEFGWLTEDQKYADLKVVVDHPFTTIDGIAYVPKTIEKGERKGEQDYKRRDNITFYPVELIEVDKKAVEQTTQVTL